MTLHLILNLEAPLLAFGGQKVDNLGVSWAFPAVSMLTGLVANALGWRRWEWEKHDNLQRRIVFAARIDREGVRVTDYQTALLYADDEGWTTRGHPEGRNRNSPSFKTTEPGGRKSLTDELYRDYYADTRVTVALRLEPADDELTLDRLAEALQEPARPLFIGRKPCLPSAPLFAGFREGDTALAALLAFPLADGDTGRPTVRTLWPEEEGSPEIEANRPYMLTDQRNWVSGLHGGGRWVCEGAIARDKFGAATETESSESEGRHDHDSRSY